MLPICNVSVQRRASGAQALAAKRKTKRRSQKFQCCGAFEKEAIGMVYNPKICPEIYEDGLVSGDRLEVRQSKHLKGHLDPPVSDVTFF